VSNTIGYTAREDDGQTGLYYYRARYYDFSTGRFLSEDPSATSGMENLFVYTFNNPLNLYDPTGLKAVKPKRPKLPPGTVMYICCQKGELRVCDQNSGAWSGWVLDCMRSHERRHIKDLTCGGENPCKGREDGPFRVTLEKSSELECAAYRGELECLIPAPRSKEIEDRRSHIRKQIGNYCGGP
jgi:RHS repeat-associated protein